MRTGSSWLCSLLDSHPDICCKQELLHRTRYKGGVGSSFKYVEDILYPEIKTHKGFKLLYHQMRGINSVSYNIFRYLINDVYKCKVIHIIRDEIEVFVSHRRAKRTKLWNVFNDNNIKIVADQTIDDLSETIVDYNKPIYVDIEDYKTFVTRYRQWKEEIKKSFNALEINYAELPDISHLCDYLNVARIKGSSSCTKLSKDTTKDAIINYSELYEAGLIYHNP